MALPWPQGQKLWALGWGQWGDRCAMWGEKPPQQCPATGIHLQHVPKGLGCTGHCVPVQCVHVLVFSMEVWCLTVCLWQENESGAATCLP